MESVEFVRRKTHKFILRIIKLMQAKFFAPEDVVVKQEEESKDLYFIAKGICSVDLHDHKKKKRRNISVLEQGTMFGEIALIYGCSRTATVLSRNYCIMAKISPEVYT